MSPQSFELFSTALHWIVGGLLALALLGFVRRFYLPGRRVGRDFAQAIERLSELKQSGQVLDLDRIREEAMISPALRHCWDEFRDTLHGQKHATAAGSMEVSRWRATAIASGFFTEQSLIDAPLRTEFFKHLPGILTGLGIIGTFSGLILGLQGFKVSDDAQVVRSSLETLILSVGSAFVLSGIAIALAMLVTFLEKSLINKRYTELEELCGLIDSLFDAGAGEEYLQRLVEASETAATQAMQMKESLVTDLKQVLTELTQQQISTITATSSQLGQSITSSLAESLAAPLAKISDAVQSVGNSQGEAVNKLLTDVLASFTTQMEGMFGAQMRGMNEMLLQTANTIQTASQRFEQLAGQIQQAGTGAADAMAKRMDEALQQMQARQGEANDQMRLFIDQLRQSVAQGQSETAELTLKMMKELSESTSALINNMQQSANETQQSHLERQHAMAAQASQMLGRQGEQVTSLTGSVSSTVAALKEITARLENSTSANIERLGLGAERLQMAANRLTDNLDMVRVTTEGLGGTADKLNESAGTLGQALTSTQQALNEHRSVRDALALMVTELRTTVENAKREASLTSELINGLQVASQRLNEAQKSADSYLEGVTEVLAEAHGAFAKQMETTLREGNARFHQELAHATGLLKSAIQDLGDVLDNLPSNN